MARVFWNSRGCPVTGRMAHRFDKETHRCACGRWERGHKPKVDPVRPRDECQICERKQAIDGSGCLVHHGYQRPGVGFIIGDCMGVGCRPYPATDALERYLAVVRGHIARFEDRLQELPMLTEFTHSYSVGYGKARERRSIVLKKGDSRKSWIEGSHYVDIPSFSDAVGWEGGRVRVDLRNAKDEEVRVVGRIHRAAGAVA